MILKTHCISFWKCDEFFVIMQRNKSGMLMNPGMGFYKPLRKNVLRIAIYYLFRWVKPILRI